MKAIGRPSSRTTAAAARRLAGSAAPWATSPLLARAPSSSASVRTAGRCASAASLANSSSRAALLQTRQLSLGSIFTKRSDAAPSTTASSSSSAAEPAPSPALEEGPVAAWSAELGELSQRAAVGSDEDVFRTEGLFREVLEAGGDEAVRKEGAQLLVDHWEKLGGWVRLLSSLALLYRVGYSGRPR